MDSPDRPGLKRIVKYWEKVGILSTNPSSKSIHSYFLGGLLQLFREKKTMSQIIRRILQQYIEQNPQSVISKSTGKKGV